MNIDKRYVEILATYGPKKTPKKWGKLSLIGFVILVIGGFLFLSGMMYGIGIGGFGVVIIGVSLLKQDKIVKQSRQEFIDYFDKNGTLPPFPEDAK